MIAECNITCGSWGSGGLAFQQLGEMLEKIMWISIWAVSALVLLWLVRQWSRR